MKINIQEEPWYEMVRRQGETQKVIKDIQMRYPHVYHTLDTLKAMRDERLHNMSYEDEHMFLLATMVDLRYEDEFIALVKEINVRKPFRLSFEHMFKGLRINTSYIDTHYNSYQYYNNDYHNALKHNIFNAKLRRSKELWGIDSMCLDVVCSYLSINTGTKPEHLYAKIMSDCIDIESTRQPMFPPLLDDALDELTLTTTQMNCHQFVTHSPFIDQHEYDKRISVHEYILHNDNLYHINVIQYWNEDDNEFEEHKYMCITRRTKMSQNKSTSVDLIQCYGHSFIVEQLVKYEQDDPEYLKCMFDADIENYLQRTNVPVLNIKSMHNTMQLLNYMSKNVCRYINSASPQRDYAYWVCSATRILYNKMKHSKSGSEYVSSESLLNYIQERFGIDTVWINGNGDLLLLERLPIDRLKAIAKVNEFNINKLSMKVAMKLNDKRLRSLLNIAELKASYINKLIKNYEVRESLKEPPRILGKQTVKWSK